MLIKDHLRVSGAYLFRWRSYAPMVFIPFMALALRNGESFELRLGELAGEIFETVVILMVAIGQAIRIFTVGHVTNGTSGRNTTRQVAESLNVTGLYSVVRNPLYLANMLMLLGAAAYTQSLTLILVMALVLALYYERIVSAEEHFLSDKFGAAYAEWAARTPAFVPRLSSWRPPALKFSWRMVIRREHPSVYGALLTLFLIDLGFSGYGAEPEGLPPGWLWLMGTATVLVVLVKILKHRTHFLDVPLGR